MEPLVSICCITYNHEKYIADTLDGFLSQETNFPFEIIVHDDASTDNTATIIRAYEKKYPRIFKGLYQNDNQFSKGKKVMFECVFPHVSGEYLAFCEGDDYWSSSTKLQEQVDFLSNHKEYAACFHGVKLVNTSGKPIGEFLGPIGRGSKDYSMNYNIRGGFIHLSSLVIRSKIINDGIPQWALDARHGDYALALIVSAYGKVYFIDKIMSSYRTGVENSIMTLLKQNQSKKNQINYHLQRIKTLNEANLFYNYQYNTHIQSVINESEIRILLLNNEIKKLFYKKYRSNFKEKGLKNTIIFILLIKVPNFTRKILSMKKKLDIYIRKFK